MDFRQESDKCEVWYTETDDPNEELKCFIADKYMTLRELNWWLENIRSNGAPDAKIHFIREHF